MMKLNKFAAALIIPLMLFMVAPAGAEDDPPRKELLFGSVAMDIPAVMHQRLTPLVDYLSEQLNMPVRLKLSPNMPAAIKNVATGKVDLAYLTPVAYIRARQSGHARIVAKTITKGKRSFRLMIIVREDSPIHSVHELAGKSFAFGDRAALLQRAAVVGAGVKLEDLGDYRFIGHYDNIVRGVLTKDFDAGIVKDTTAYKWEGKGIRILYRSPNLPPYNISAAHNVSPGLVKRIRTAFLKLDKTNPKHRAVLAALDKNYDGFAPTTDAEYNIVRTLIAPFSRNP